MSMLFFMKVNRSDNSLEHVLEKIRTFGAQVEEFTARCSLDNTFFFVRLTIQASGSPELLRSELSSLQDIRDIEVEVPAAS